MAQPPKPKRGKIRDPEEYKRFLETAREVEAKEDPEALERGLKKIIRPKSRPAS